MTSASGSSTAFSARYAAALQALRVAHPGSIRDARVLQLPARIPPWTGTKLAVERGNRVSLLASGEVRWGVAGISAEARFHLWARIGAAPVFRTGSDTVSFTSTGTGELELCILQGKWKTPAGELESPIQAYEGLDGGIDVLAIRWGDVTAQEGLAQLESVLGQDALIATERTRLEAAHALPSGFEPLWFVGASDVFRVASLEDAPALSIRCDRNAGIVRRPLDAPLERGTFLEWDWRVNELPSRVAENAFHTHDYSSIALEFDDGRDLTWYWSAALDPEHHFRCPLPAWSTETHLVVRSGTNGLGTWQSERRDVHGDVARALSDPPRRIVAVWLIGVSLFQRTLASTDFRRIRLVRADGQSLEIFPS